MDISPSVKKVNVFMARESSQLTLNYETNLSMSMLPVDGHLHLRKSATGLQRERARITCLCIIRCDASHHVQYQKIPVEDKYPGGRAPFPSPKEINLVLEGDQMFKED